MRVRISWFVALGLVWLSLRPGFAIWDTLGEQLAPGVWTEKLREETTRSSAFVVRPERFAKLPLTEEKTTIRLLTNASLSKQALERTIDSIELQRWEYAIEYQYLDGSQNVLDTGVYRFRTNCVLYRDRRTGDLFSPTFFASRSRVPATTRPMVINAKQIPDDAEFLQLRLADSDKGVRDVVVRTYVPMDKAQRAGQKWKRLSPGKRRQLGRANVYPTVLFSDSERQRLLDNQWTLVLPRGVPGSDYDSRKLYTLKEVDGQVVYDRALPFGIPVTAGVCGTIPIPDQPGVTRLEFNARQLATYSESPKIEIRYHAPTRKTVDAHVVALDSSRDREFKLPTAGGIIEVIASDAFSVEAYWRAGTTDTRPNNDHADKDHTDNAEAWTEITPTEELLKAYELSGGATLDYAIAHVGDAKTPFRLAIRKRDNGTRDNPVVRWHTLRNDGVVLSSGTIHVDALLSHYDRIIDAANMEAVSDVVQRFFAFTPEVDRFRIVVDKGDVLVAAYSRPPSLRSTVRIPQDYSAYERAHSENNRWFLLWPVDVVDEATTVSISIQSRPPVYDEDILAGRYEWRDFLPVGARPARQLLTQRNDHVPFRSEASEVVYRRVTPNSDSQFEFIESDDSGSVRSRLIFRTEHWPQTVRVFVDGELLEQRELHTSTGTLDLPSLQPGLQTLRLETEDDETELFLNNVRPNDGPSYLKRLVHPLAENETLTFTYDRTNDEREFAILRIFRNADELEPTRLRIRIVAKRNDDNNGSLNWTDLDREVTIQPSSPILVHNTEQSLSLDPSIADLDSGQPIFLRIGDDIVDQRLKIEVEYLDGPTGFVTLYQLSDKLEFDSQFTVEPGI